MNFDIKSQRQREAYFTNGYLLLERVISDDWVERLRATTREMVEQSRDVTRSDAKWLIGGYDLSSWSERVA